MKARTRERRWRLDLLPEPAKEPDPEPTLGALIRPLDLLYLAALAWLLTR